MNLLQLAGHLGSDAETRFTQGGQKVTTFRIATNSRRQGKEETTWWRVTIWGDRFDKMVPYLKKGTSVIIFGELSKPEIYTDKEGHPQVSLNVTAEIVKFSPFGKPADRPATQNYAAEEAAPAPSFAAAPQYGFSQDTEKDDLPF